MAAQAQRQNGPHDNRFMDQFKQEWSTAVSYYEYDFPSIVKMFVTAVANTEDILQRLGKWPGDTKLAAVVKDADEGIDVLDGMDTQDLAVVLFHEAAAILKSRQAQGAAQ